MKVQFVPLAWVVRSAEAFASGETLSAHSYLTVLDQRTVERRDAERRLTARADEEDRRRADRRAVLIVEETIRLAFADRPRKPAARQSARFLKAA